MARKSESRPHVSESGEYSGSTGGPTRDTEAFSSETPVTAMRDPEWRPAVRTDEGKEPEWMKRPEGREWTQDDGDEGPVTRLPEVPSLGSLDTPALIAICIGVFVGVFLVGAFTLMWWMKTTPDTQPVEAPPAVEKTHEGLPVRKGIQ